MPGPVPGTQNANPSFRLPADPSLPMPPAVESTRPSSNFVDQMLSVETVSEAGAGSSSYYGEDSGGGDCGDVTSCGAGYLGDAPPSPWYASITALTLGRDKGNRVFTTYETNDVSNNELLDLPFSWRWGGEVRFGRRFCRGCRGTAALEATYWATESFNGFESLSLAPPNSLSTPLNVSFIEMLDPWAAPPDSAYRDGTAWFDAAASHRLWRHYEIHNVEINALLGRGYDPAQSSWDINWLVGVRFFRFREGLNFGSVAWGYQWGEGGGVYEAYIRDQVTNDLVGVQFGFDANYRLLSKCRLFMAPRFNISNNQIDNFYNIHRGDGSPARPTAASNQTGSFPVHSSENQVAFLMQTDVGLQWDFSANWSARIGYRVVAVTGVALADNQIPFYTVDIPAVADIDGNGDLILHGAYVGASYNF